MSSEPVHPLQIPQFRRYWFSRIAGVMGSQMLLVAMGWQMYELTGSAWDLGLVGLAQFLPALLLALPAGHTVDRHERQRVLALVLMVLLACALGLAAASAGQWLNREGLLAAAVVMGGMRAYQMPAQTSLLPQLVSAQLLPRALAMSAAGLQGAIITGPALGGLIFSAGAAVVYACSALGFALAWWGVAGLKPRAAQRLTDAPSWHTLLAGVRFVFSHKVILGAISLDLFAVLLGGATALLPLFARDILHTGPWGLGVLRAAPAVGALGMSLWLARHPVRQRCGAWLLIAVAVYGASMIGFGLSVWLPLSWLALAVGGAADMVSVVVRQTLIQLETPDDMRGRVSAVSSVFIGASNQLGEFESGATAAWIGPVASVVLGGIGTGLVVLTWLRVFPALARRDALVPLPARSMR